MMRDALGHPPRVDEDERGAMRAHVCGDGVEHLAELLARRHRLELPEGSSMATSSARRWPTSTMAQRGLPSGLLRDAPAPTSNRATVSIGSLRRGETDAHRRLRAEPLETLERDREVGAALVPRDRVDLVDDDRRDRARAPPGSAAR